MSSKPVGHIGSIVRRHWVVTLILLFGLVYACFYWLMTPTVNPNPIKKVVMRG